MKGNLIMIRKQPDEDKWYIHFTDGRKEGPFDSYNSAKIRDTEIKKIMHIQGRKNKK